MKNASMAVAVNDDKVDVKSSEKQVDEEELSGMALLQELNRPKQELEGLGC